MSETPRFSSAAITVSIIGTPFTLTSGLATVSVSGFMRLPSPAAINIATSPIYASVPMNSFLFACGGSFGRPRSSRAPLATLISLNTGEPGRL